MIVPLDLTWDKMTDQQFIDLLQNIILKDKYLMVAFFALGIFLGVTLTWQYFKSKKQTEKKQ